MGGERQRQRRERHSSSFNPTASVLSNERETIAYLGDRGSGFHAKFVKNAMTNPVAGPRDKI